MVKGYLFFLYLYQSFHPCRTAVRSRWFDNLKQTLTLSSGMEKVHWRRDSAALPSLIAYTESEKLSIINFQLMMVH